jgi:alkylhydroperoxidase/carboxymuconolactone decarboxylase family protein YurZ
MDDIERRAIGLRTRRKVLGDAYVDHAEARKTEFTAEFQDLLTRYVWSEIWTRPTLDERSRRILAIGTLLALGRWDEFRMHARAAMTEGRFSADDLKEIVLQQALYCGIPAANTAFEVLREVVTPGT